MQSDLSDLRDYIRYTLIPLVFDQVASRLFPLSYPLSVATSLSLSLDLLTKVSGVETALQHIEMVSNMILAKRLIKTHLKAKTIPVPRPHPEIEMNSSSPERNGTPPQGSDSDKSPTAVGGAVGGGGAKKKKESDGMEQALILKGELDRVLSGVKLLGDTVDRLNEIVRSDSRCCSGAFDTIWLSLIGPSSLGGGGGNGTIQGGYASVRLDDSAHG
jgi:hypothetical protein